MWIGSQYSLSWMELRCRMFGIRFKAYCGLKRPIILEIKREHSITPEMRVCHKIYGKILYGQVSICGEIESPYWVMDHCDFTEQKIEYIKLCSICNKQFHDYLYRYCKERIDNLKIDMEVIEYANFHCSVKNPLRNNRKLKMWIDVHKRRLLIPKYMKQE
jgi:hypothetical protein